MTTKYMHTIDGKPAGFCDGAIYLNTSQQYGQTWAPLCDSLAEIRKQQRASVESWCVYGYPYMGYDQFKYGYVRIKV